MHSSPKFSSPIFSSSIFSTPQDCSCSQVAEPIPRRDRGLGPFTLPPIPAIDLQTYRDEGARAGQVFDPTKGMQVGVRVIIIWVEGKNAPAGGDVLVIRVVTGLGLGLLGRGLGLR